MKTPEQMADEYVEIEFKGNGSNVSRAVCKHDYMSGYKAAIDLIHSRTTKEMSNLANAFAVNYFGKQYAVSFDSFLAGYQAGRLNSEGVQAAKDQLADADKVMPQWISVKERLPEVNTDVLVKVSKGWVESDDNGNNPKPLTYDFYSVMSLYYENNQHVWDTRPVTDACPLKWEDVTHWMPLPEAPKEEK